MRPRGLTSGCDQVGQSNEVDQVLVSPGSASRRMELAAVTFELRIGLQMQSIKDSREVPVEAFHCAPRRFKDRAVGSILRSMFGKMGDAPLGRLF